MRRTILISAGLVGALLLAAAPAPATSDPATAVRDDVVHLQNDVRSAHSILAPDLAALRAKIGHSDGTALKSAANKLRADAKSVLPVVQKDRKQLLSDIEAARAAGISLGSGPESSDMISNGALGRIQSIQHQMRSALEAYRNAQPAKTKHTNGTKSAHVHGQHAHANAATHVHGQHVHSNPHAHPHAHSSPHAHPHAHASHVQKHTHAKKKS